MNRVVVTAMGVVCGNADDKNEFAAACFEGKQGIKNCTAFNTNGLSTSFFGEIENLDNDTRFFTILKKSAASMLNDAQICKDDIISWGNKCRMFFGTLIFSSHYFYRHSLAKKDGKADNFIAHMNDFSNYAKEILGVKGAAEIISSSCSSGTTAAGMAADYIRAGLCECAIVGGVDSLSIVTAYGFNSLKSLSGSICNPFDENRDGINIGECGAMFLFESLEHAKKRNAKIYCEVAGYATGNDAYHITSPEPNGEGAFNTMKAALDDAKISAADIDYINAHGTGTLINDSMETKAIEKLFGNIGKNISVSSTKSLIGHCMGASGAIELASIILSMKNKKYIPMPNLKKNIFTAENLKVSNKTFDLNIDYAISNSFAFSGNSAALVVKNFEGGEIN